MSSKKPASWPYAHRRWVLPWRVQANKAAPLRKWTNKQCRRSPSTNRLMTFAHCVSFPLISCIYSVVFCSSSPPRIMLLFEVGKSFIIDCFVTTKSKSTRSVLALLKNQFALGLLSYGTNSEWRTHLKKEHCSESNWIESEKQIGPTYQWFFEQ